MESSGVKVNNVDDLFRLLNSVPLAVRSQATIDGMKKAAQVINTSAVAKLSASKKGASKTGYSYYASAFKVEDRKFNNSDEFGIKTGVYDRKNGYKLRWLEFGTGERFTRKKKLLSGKVSEKKYRGKMTGSHFFFGTLRQSEDYVFKTVSDAILKSLEKLQ